MQIHVRLTSLLAVKAKRALLEVELPEGSTLVEFQEELKRQLGPLNAPLAFTLNGKNLTDPSLPLPDGGQITVLIDIGMP